MVLRIVDLSHWKGFRWWSLVLQMLNFLPYLRRFAIVKRLDHANFLRNLLMYYWTVLLALSEILHVVEKLDSLSNTLDNYRIKKKKHTKNYCQ